MQPQAGKKKKPQQQVLDQLPVDSRAPMTVKGQKYVAPLGRHSQQTHVRAEARAAAGGHASEREQHDHDRTVVAAGIAEGVAEKARRQQSK